MESSLVFRRVRVPASHDDPDADVPGEEVDQARDYRIARSEGGTFIVEGDVAVESEEFQTSATCCG